MAERIPIYHKGCTGIVCYSNHRLGNGETMRSADITFPNGEHPRPDSRFRLWCDGCHKIVVSVHELEYREFLSNSDAPQEETVRS